MTDRALDRAAAEEFARTLLLGELIRRSVRAADMEMFAFGADTTWHTAGGELATTPRVALHLQCAWRIARDDAVFVGSGDLWQPRSDHPDSDSFDPDVEGMSRRDELLHEFFAGDDAPRVSRVDLGAAGLLHVEFSDGSALDVLPDASDYTASEAWRLFEVGRAGPQLVVSPSEINLLGED